MIDIDNYRRSIAWMKRNLLALEQSPDDKIIQDATLQSFEVTFNLSEEVLRNAFLSLRMDREAAYLSFREVIYRADDEGVGFTSNKHWLEYGMALESIRATFFVAAELNLDAAFRSLLTRYVAELESFTIALERKLAARA